MGTFRVDEGLEAICCTVHYKCRQEAASVFAPSDSDDSHETTALGCQREKATSKWKGNWAFFRPIIEQAPPKTTQIMTTLANK